MPEDILSVPPIERFRFQAYVNPDGTVGSVEFTITGDALGLDEIHELMRAAIILARPQQGQRAATTTVWPSGATVTEMA